jgi:hypothetical protein
MTKKEAVDYVEHSEVRDVFEEAQGRRGLRDNFVEDDVDAQGFWGVTVRAYEDG